MENRHDLISSKQSNLLIAFLIFALMKKTLATIFAAAGLVFSLTGGQINAQDFPAYRSELNIVYSTVAGKDLKLNAFLPTNECCRTYSRTRVM